MAKKQYLDLDGLKTYDGQIKAYIDSADVATSTKLTNGTITVKKAEHATTADSATDATNATNATTSSKLGSADVGSSTQPIYLKAGVATKVPSVGVAYGGTGATDAAGARTNLGVYSTSEVDSKVSTAVSGLASTSSVNSAISTHNSAADAHTDIRTTLAEVKEDVDTFFKDADFTASAKDTLKEIQAYITSDAEAAAAMTASINGKADKNTTLSGYGITNAYTKTEVDNALSAKAAQSSLDSHTGNTTVHITSTERNNWNAAYTHSQAGHAPSDAQKNQNAFSNIAVSGQTTVAADTATDTVTFAGTNVTITTDATNDKVTFAVADGTTSAKGLVQLTDSTSSTSTTTAATPKNVKSAYDLANTAKTNAATAQSTADGAASVASEAKTAAAANTQAISANTSAISSLTGRVATLEGLDTHEAIPTASITALFA